MEERDGFFFFRSFYDSISLLPGEDQLALYQAIARFSLDGKEPEGLSNTQSAFWMLIKPVLDKSAKRSVSGKKGGSKTQANIKQTPSKCQANEEQTPSKPQAPCQNDGVGEGFASDLLSVCSYSDSESDKGQGTRDKGQGIKDKGQGITDEGSGDASTGGLVFTTFWNAYPERARRDRKRAYSAWIGRGLHLSDAAVKGVLADLDAWKRSDQWAEDGGRYIPKPENFIRHYVGVRPAKKEGANIQPSGRLGEAELESIRQMLEAE